ncbi:sugar transferase [Roseovarius sp. MMSF_3281]|uniref:sugar transferase n=1 Tax=Roseovarius sp. MMSF_3281 TaxID=3046694 RepID=UPI00273E6FA5|nr:sugar transferase [Roseovarius sp. MMSF_3281]
MTLSKRVFDLVLLLLLSVFLIPILLVVVALMLARGERPVFYGAERMRCPERGFTLWKIRTMTPAGNDSGVSGGDKRDRITPLGHRLRRRRMDELPQMWNILRGDISFVGPRPPLRIYVERFPQVYGKVLESQPGVTGLASLVFAAHEEKLLRACKTPEETDRTYERRCIPRKAHIDLLYQRHQGIGLDAWLVAVTAGRFLGLAPRKGRLPRRRRS